MESLWRHMLGNSLMLLVTRIFAKVSTIIVTITIARNLGADSFGLISTILALTSVSSLLSDFGLVLPTIRAVSYADSDAAALVGSTISARIFWSMGSLVVGAVAGVLLDLPLVIVLFLASSSLFEISSNALVRSFEGRQEMGPVTLYTVLERLSFCGCVLGALTLFGTVEAVAIAYLFSHVVMLVVAYTFFRARFSSLQMTLSFHDLRTRTLIGLPFFGTAVFSALYYKSDTLVLSSFQGHAEVGYYNAALRVIDAQIFVPVTLMATIFPTLTRMHKERDYRFPYVFRRSLIIVTLLGATAAGVVYAAAPMLINLLYSPEYSESVAALRVLSFSLFPLFIYYLFGHSLIAVNKEHLFTAAMAGAAILNIILCYVVIPQSGFIGASWTRVATETFLCTVLGIMVLTQRRSSKRLPVVVPNVVVSAETQMRVSPGESAGG